MHGTAVYQFADKLGWKHHARLRRIPKSMIADFNRSWPRVSRARAIL